MICYKWILVNAVVSKQNKETTSISIWEEYLPVISVLQLMSLVDVLKGDRAERSLSEKILNWELSSLNLASFRARLDSEDGLGDSRLSICSFLVIGAEMLVRFELMASDSGSGSSPSSNSDVSTSTFSLLHRVTLWRMNLIMSCRGKFVWHTPHTRRSFSCSTEN